MMGINSHWDSAGPLGPERWVGLVRASDGQSEDVESASLFACPVPRCQCCHYSNLSQVCQVSLPINNLQVGQTI